ncbi:MAG: hypothetical protein ACRENJ_02605 [Candidatus Eiseniibacteriota bacterium]
MMALLVSGALGIAVANVVLYVATGSVLALVIALAGLLVALLLALAGFVLGERRLLRRARAKLEALEGTWPRRHEHQEDEGLPPARRTVGSLDLDQDDYAEVLTADRARILRDFEWSRAAGTWHCRRCRRKAALIGIAHPIWDGPFDGAGSGVVDTRDVPWCPRCDELADLGGLAIVLTSVHGGAAAGLPIRLPWLGQLPIRLRPELFERAAFHWLPVQVERFRPPPPADTPVPPAADQA